MSFFVLNLSVLAEEDFAPSAKSAILVDNLSGKVSGKAITNTTKNHQSFNSKQYTLCLVVISKIEKSK